MADTNPWVLDLSSNPPDIYNETLNEHNRNAFQPPYPQIFWYVNETENDVIHDGELDYEKMGAFCHCTELNRIIIPPTVKHIGEYAFRNTKLRSVTIASDCTYSETSFPNGCVVNFYPD